MRYQYENSLNRKQRINVCTRGGSCGKTKRKYYCSFIIYHHRSKESFTHHLVGIWKSVDFRYKRNSSKWTADEFENYVKHTQYSFSCRIKPSVIWHVFVILYIFFCCKNASNQFKLTIYFYGFYQWCFFLFFFVIS